MIDSAGLVHIREAMCRCRRAGRRRALRRRPGIGFGEVHRDVVAADEPGDGNVAVVVMEGGDQARQQRRGIQHRAAEHARVHCMLQDLDFDGAVHQSAKAGGQGRNADLPVAGIRHDDDVGAQQLPVGFQEGRKVGEPASSSPSKRRSRPGRARRQGPRHGSVGGDVRHDSGFVVGGAAAVEPAVRSTAVKGSVSHSAGSPGGWTSWWAYSRMVGLPSAASRRATTAGPPGVPSSLSHRRIRTSSKPAPRSKCGNGFGAAVQGRGIETGPGDAGDATRSFRSGNGGLKACVNGAGGLRCRRRPTELPDLLRGCR